MSTCPQCGTTYPPQVSICVADGMVLVTQEPATDPMVGTVIAGKYRIDGVIGAAAWARSIGRRTSC